MAIKKFFSSKTDYVKVEDKNRFYYMLQQMQANRWRITAIVLGLFTLIILGINAGVFFGKTIGEDWKEMLLILLGAFVGIVNLGNRMTGSQWWSKKFQFVMSVVIAGLVVLTFLKKVKSWTIPAAMLFSLVGGIIQSFVVGFC